jgi:hypothetical protein
VAILKGAVVANLYVPILRDLEFARVARFERRVISYASITTLYFCGQTEACTTSPCHLGLSATLE